MSETSDTKPHLALSYIDSLSVWEICHRYWGYHPDETDTKCLPLDVQDFMRQMLLSNGFEFHDANGKEFLDIYIPFVLFGITYPRLEKIERQVRKTGWLPMGELTRVWQPSRLKGIQVSPDYGTPFLAATQVFDLRPVPRKFLSLDRTDSSAERFVTNGMILVTCSGNVGPCFSQKHSDFP